MKIYILTSNYRVYGAFTTEEKALKAKEVLNLDYIEEYELDEIGKDNKYAYIVTIFSNGNTRVNATRYLYNSSEKFNAVRKIEYSLEAYTVNVLAENEEHAVKIASDLIAQFKVLNDGN